MTSPDEMATVRMTMDIVAQVSRSRWADQFGLGDLPTRTVDQDVRDYIHDHVIEGMTSRVIADLGGTFTARVAPRAPRTLLVLEGHELSILYNALDRRQTNAGGLRTLRIEPRPNGLAWKVNEGPWSNTQGHRAIAE